MANKLNSKDWLENDTDATVDDELTNERLEDIEAEIGVIDDDKAFSSLTLKSFDDDIEDEKLNDIEDKKLDDIEDELGINNTTLRSFDDEVDFESEINSKSDRMFTPEDEKTTTEKLADHAVAQGVDVATGGTMGVGATVVANEIQNRAIDGTYDAKEAVDEKFDELNKTLASAFDEDDPYDKDAEFEKQRAIDEDKIEAYALDQSSDYDLSSSESNMKNETATELHDHIAVPHTVTMSGVTAANKTVAKFDVKSDYVPPETEDEKKHKEEVKHELSENAKIGVQTLKNVIDAMPDGEKKDKAMEAFNALNPTPQQQANMPTVMVNKMPTVDIQPPSQGNQDRGR